MTASSKHQDRAIEWYSALLMIVWGVVLALPGETFSQAQYGTFATLSLTELQFAAAYFSVGAVRCVALYINGRWPKSAVIRWVGSFFGIIMWGNVAHLLYDSSVAKTGVFTPAPFVYLLLAVFEVYSVYRAAFDARYHREPAGHEARECLDTA